MKLKLITTGLILAAIALQAESFAYTDYIKVVESKPLHKKVTQRIPYEECWDEEVPVHRGHSRNQGNTFENNLGSIIGGVAGGILGHQVGGGSGKTAATVGGAIIGTLVGKNLSNNDGYSNDRDREIVTYETQRKCVTKYRESVEKKFVGYKNIGYYRGERIIKFSDRKLRNIPIRVTVDY